MMCIKSDMADSFQELRLTLKPIKPFVNTAWYLLYRTSSSLTKLGRSLPGWYRNLRIFEGLQEENNSPKAVYIVGKI